MPARQATPGPSTGIVLQQQHPNTRKRSISETDTDTHNGAKKHKQDEATVVSKEKNKKSRARKRRKKLSVTMSPVRSRSKSRSAPATQQKPGPSMLETQWSAPPDSVAAETLPAIGVEDATPDTLHADKGKGKAKEIHESSQPQGTSTEIPTSAGSPQAQIARLTKELGTATTLLQRHQAHLSQIHQSLTCQICLDLLHKPFALAPCGHVVCHGCLVRWFTAPAEEASGGTPARPHIHKKTCPICRSVISERPVEVWTVKGMVGGLVRSALVDLPVPPPASVEDDAPTQAVDGNSDPWRNIFRPVRRHNSLPFVLPRLVEQPGGSGLEDMGMYDAEDGGIYRCIDCMNEIWDGVCTGCNRVYPGHRVGDDGDDVDLSDDDDSLMTRRRNNRVLRNLVGMFANRHEHFHGDTDELESLDDESLDDDDEEPIIDHIPWEEQDRYRQMGMAHVIDGFPPFDSGPPPIMGGMHGMQLFANFTEDEEEGGIAMIEEASVDEGEAGYESSFIDDSVVGGRPRAMEVIELSDSEDGGGDAGMPRLARRTRRWRVADSDPFEDEEDDGIDFEEMRNLGGRMRMRASAFDLDEDESSEPGSASPRVRFPGRRAPIVIDSDEELEVVRSGRRVNRGRHAFYM